MRIIFLKLQQLWWQYFALPTCCYQEHGISFKVDADMTVEEHSPHGQLKHRPACELQAGRCNH